MKKLLSVAVLGTGLFLVACGHQTTTQAPTTPAKQTDSTAQKTSDSNLKELTLEQAKKIAFEDAGVTEADVMNLAVEEDMDLMQKSFDISFDANNEEYSYKIDQSNGSILERKVEMADGVVATSVDTSKAKEVALADAGLSESAVTNLRVKQDNDDMVVVFDVDFVHNGMEYHYVIDANSTNIIEKEIESVND
ncbi:PepSY domain-containing protein [Streptococcus fryi]